MDSERNGSFHGNNREKWLTKNGRGIPDTNELRKIGRQERNADRWKQTMITVVNRVANLRIITTQINHITDPCFFWIDLEFDKKKLTVQVSENFESFVNVILKEGEFTFYELEEFVKIKAHTQNKCIVI